MSDLSPQSGPLVPGPPGGVPSDRSVGAAPKKMPRLGRGTCRGFQGDIPLVVGLDRRSQPTHVGLRGPYMSPLGGPRQFA
jgi:hypothetical protein